MAKEKTRKMTFRQRVREDAEKQLAKIWTRAHLAIGDVAIEHGLRPADLAKLLSDGDHKTLRNQMITTLANNKEAEIEKLYNSHMLTMALGDKDAD